jgi:hypothetical protein
MNTLYYNLGISDIIVDNQQRFGSVYKTTKALYEGLMEQITLNFHAKGIQIPKETIIQYPFREKNSEETIQKEVDRIEFPLLSKLMDKLYKDGRKPVLIYLFATEQEPVHSKDTYYLACLIKVYLIQKFRIDEQNISIQTISENPSEYSKMIKLYRDFILEHEEDINIQRYNITQISAGTPAMNFALAQSLMNKPGATFYNIPENISKEAYEDTTFNELNLRKYIDTIKNLLENYDYAGARKVIRYSPFGNNEVLDTILHVLNQRKNFHITKEIINNAVRFIDDKAKDSFPNLYEDMYCLYTQQKEYKYTEFYYQIRIYFNIHNFTGAIALIFSFFDNLLQHLVEQLLDFRLDDITNNKSEKLKATIEKNEELNQKFEKSNLDKRMPSGKVLHKIINFFKKRDGKAQSFIETYHKFESFQNIRNHGPFAHGTQGISKEQIEEQYDGTIQNIIHDLETLLKKLHLLQDTFSYDAYNSRIIEYMEKKTGIDLN